MTECAMCGGPDAERMKYGIYICNEHVFDGPPEEAAAFLKKTFEAEVRCSGKYHVEVEGVGTFFNKVKVGVWTWLPPVTAPEGSDRSLRCEPHWENHVYTESCGELSYLAGWVGWNYLSDARFTP